MKADGREMMRFFAVLVLFWSSLYVFLPVMAPFAQLRGASLQTVGWIISAYGLVQLVLRVPLGVWSDRTGRRQPFITYGFVASLAGALGMGLVDNPLAMFFFRGLTGVTASMWIMFTVLYAARFAARDTARAMGLAMMATNLTQLAATLGGGLAAERWGWQAPFMAAAVLAAAGWWLSRSLQEAPSAAGPAPDIKELLHMGRQPRLLTVSLLGAVLQCVPHMTVWGFTTVYAVALGAGPAQLGWLSFGAGIAMAAAAYLSGSVLAPRFGSRLVVIGGFSLAALGAVFFPFVSSVYSLMVLQMAVSFGTALTFPTLMGLSIKAVPQERRATAMGFFQAIYSLGMFGGPLAGGLLAQHFGLAAVFTGAAGFAAAGAVAAFWLLSAAEVRRPAGRVLKG